MLESRHTPKNNRHRAIMQSELPGESRKREVALERVDLTDLATPLS